MANKIAQEPTKSEEPLSSEDDVEDDKSLLGLDAKIPGGRFEIDTMCTI